MDDIREEHSIMTLGKRIREEVPRRDRNPTLIRGSDQAAMGGSRDGGGRSCRVACSCSKRLRLASRNDPVPPPRSRTRR